MTCRGNRHTASAYGAGQCRCDLGRDAHRRQTKLRAAGLNKPYFLDATGTRRRVEGLLAMGWTGNQIAAAAGLSGGTHAARIGARGRCVKQQTVDGMKRAAALLGGAPGPSALTKGHARALGYVPLWAWDDDTIDDPAAVPAVAPDGEVVDEVAIERAIQAARAGRPPTKLSKLEARAVVARLASRPYLMHDNAIAAGMHRSQSWVTATRDRLGVPQVVVRAAPGRRAA
jgi:hypothetical protein